METKTLICPHCGKHLIELEKGAVGTVALRCPRCKADSEIEMMEDGEMRGKVLAVNQAYQSAGK